MAGWKRMAFHFCWLPPFSGDIRVFSWEPKGTPPMPPPQEIAGLIKGLLTIGFP